MPSGPGFFPSFNIFSSLLTSAFDGGFVLTLNNISAIGLSAGGSLLRISLKCSSHLDLCSASLFMVLPYLSFTGFEGFLLFPASVLVISQSSFMSLLCIAISACVDRSLMYFCFFSYALLDCFFSCQYFVWCIFLLSLNWAPTSVQLLYYSCERDTTSK